MNHYLKNILIVDRRRFGSRVGITPWRSLSTMTIASMDIVLIEEDDGQYTVFKNRFGPDEYTFAAKALPRFLQRPHIRYES